jgi:hypothetical protein
MITRSSLLSLLLIVAIGLVLTKTYWLWTSGPWDLPNPRKAKSPIAGEDAKAVANPRPIIGTETIISKNIFDPERGAGLSRETEANSQAFQRIRGMVLLGTAILGNNRFAILQDGGVSPGAAAASSQSSAPMRIKLGDTVEGFRLSEISEKRVVFARGTATVEVPLDFFRKIDVAQTRGPVAGQTSPPGQAPAPGVVAPRVITPVQPNVPGQQPPGVVVPRAVTPGQPTVPGQRVPRATLPRRERQQAEDE